MPQAEMGHWKRCDREFSVTDYKVVQDDNNVEEILAEELHIYLVMNFLEFMSDTCHFRSGPHNDS